MVRLIHFSLIFTFLFISRTVLAIDTISITQGHASAIPIAINNFDVNDSSEKTIADNIGKIINADLKNCGLFRPISSAAFIEKTIGIDHKPLFAAWRQINSNLLLNSHLEKISSSKLKISFVLWDNILEKDIVAEELEVPVALWRRAGHKIADKIYEKVTGDAGYFDTKIAYVSETGPFLQRQKRIAIMDYDGANHQFLTDGKNLVLTPRFSPQTDKILYLSYAKKKQPHVYMRDLKTGRDSIVGNFPGMTFAPRFSSSGDKALLSMARGGSTHIYEYNFKNKKLQKLTDGNSINTSPTYSPDGTQITFNSDRSGTRQIYVMNSDGSNVERISFGGGVYTAPAWSPRGDYIAFTQKTPTDGFTIGVFRPNGTGERLIASGFLVEGPSWAPNGRVIMYTKGEPTKGKAAGRTRIFSIDISGYNEREIPTPKDASDPEWSNVLN